MTNGNQQKVYAYTQHVVTVRIIEESCDQKIVVLPQNRARDPVDDILSQISEGERATLYAVLPIDKVVELVQRAPWLKVRLLQLDGSIVEKITGRPYDPKAEYEPDVIKAALRIVEVRGGSIRYMTLEEFAGEIVKKGYRQVGVFNDVMREGLRIALTRIGVDVELVKTCDSDCVQVNPPGYQSGYRISFPGTVGRLTAEQIADMLLAGAARIYYAEIDATTVQLCS